MLAKLPDEIVQKLPGKIARAIEFTLMGFQRFLFFEEDKKIEIEFGHQYDGIGCRFEPFGLTIVFYVGFTNDDSPEIYEFDLVMVELKDKGAECFLCGPNDTGDWENDDITEEERNETEFIARFLRFQFQNIAILFESCNKHLGFLGNGERGTGNGQRSTVNREEFGTFLSIF